MHMRGQVSSAGVSSCVEYLQQTGSRSHFVLEVGTESEGLSEGRELISESGEGMLGLGPMRWSSVLMVRVRRHALAAL